MIYKIEVDSVYIPISSFSIRRDLLSDMILTVNIGSLIDMTSIIGQEDSEINLYADGINVFSGNIDKISINESVESQQITIEASQKDIIGKLSHTISDSIGYSIDAAGLMTLKLSPVNWNIDIGDMITYTPYSFLVKSISISVNESSETMDLIQGDISGSVNEVPIGQTGCDGLDVEGFIPCFFNTVVESYWNTEETTTEGGNTFVKYLTINVPVLDDYRILLSVDTERYAYMSVTKGNGKICETVATIEANKDTQVELDSGYHTIRCITSQPIYADNKFFSFLWREKLSGT